jgi:hypothetical protein
MKLRIASLLVLVAGLAVATTTTAPALADRGSDDRQQDDSRSSSRNSRELRFVARMRDADGATARARYRERDRNGRAVRQSFDVEIKRAQPGQQFEVHVDGRSVGVITIGNLGIGKLELRRSPDSPNDQPIPSDFPRLRTGAVITVGAMQGTLSAQ